MTAAITSIFFRIEEKGKGMVRSIISIISGYLIFGVAVLLLWIAFGYRPHSIPPTGFLVFSVFCECLFALGSGYVVALIARRGELLHAGILTAIFVVLGFLSVLMPVNHLPLWVNLTTIFPTSPCILLGGWIRMKTAKGKLAVS
jgi:hypothetical protein